ncbi:MAG: hypothetical protein ACRD2X_05945 [Vicinamibacteraceae bacterium]
MSASEGYAVVVHVGPERIELQRLSDLMASFDAWERRQWYWVLIDDSTEDRCLLQHVRLPRGSKGVSLRNPRPRTDGGRLMRLGAGTLAATAHVRAHAHARFVLKIDTDALVIGPFVDAITTILMREPGAGIVGTIGDSSNPARRNVRKLEMVPRLVRMLQLLPEPTPGVPPADATIDVKGLGCVTPLQRHALAQVGPHIRKALENGFTTLRYCQGGAYVMTPALVQRMAEAGYFDTSHAWTHISVGEDVLMAMYASAVGLRLVDCCGASQPFAVQWRGLPYEPSALIANGHGLVHSLKGDPRYSEPALRTYFAAARAAAKAV